MELKRNRTIFSEKGNILNEEEIKARDAKSLEEHKNSQNEYNPQFSLEETEFLNSVNFDLLKRILDDIAERCGVDPKTLNFLPKERIVPNIKITERGSYSSQNNLIQFHIHGFPDLSDYTDSSEVIKDYEEGIKKIRTEITEHYGSLKIYMLESIIHEQIHAISKIKLKEETNKIEDQIGYQTGEYAEDTAIFFFKSLNEGLTQKLTNQVLHEYLKRSVRDQEEFKIFQKNNNSIYLQEVKLVDAMILRIAENTKQSERVVWEAMVRGLIEGSQLDEIDVKNLFTEIFGKNFLSKLKRASPRGQENRGSSLPEKQTSLNTHHILHDLEESDFNIAIRTMNLSFFKPRLLDKLAEFYQRVTEKLKNK